MESGILSEIKTVTRPFDDLRFARHGLLVDPDEALARACI
jgi:hypothetical protein